MKQKRMIIGLIVLVVILLIGGIGYVLWTNVVRWEEVLADVEPWEKAGEDYILVEVTGKKFQWMFRYPGKDQKLGAKNYKLYSKENPLGQVWEDSLNKDDFHTGELVLPVGKKVRLTINAQDVVHGVYIPQFRVKMDAVPGMPTYFVFTPMITTDSMRLQLKKKKKWNTSDKQKPDKKRWETFDYELVCNEVCGKGHYDMHSVVRIVEEEEYQLWLEKKEQSSYYKEHVSKRIH